MQNCVVVVHDIASHEPAVRVLGTLAAEWLHTGSASVELWSQLLKRACRQDIVDYGDSSKPSKKSGLSSGPTPF